LYHNILIVDDEAHVTEALLALLKSQEDLECEVFAANSAEEALALAEKERIDLMITDINMPDVSGLELLRIMGEKWPFCQVIMLTGYSDFSNVYEAFQLKAAGFLLKTESDEQIIAKVRDVLRQGEERLKQEQLLRKPAVQTDPRLWEPLNQPDGEQRKALLSQMKALPSHNMVLCLCGDLEGRAPELDTLIRYYMGERVRVLAYCNVPSAERVVWLLQPVQHDMAPSLLSNMLETVQNSYRSSTGEEFSCAIAPVSADNIRETFPLLMEALASSHEHMGSISILNPLALNHKSTEYTIRFVKKYIAEHIADDISIPLLASVTGYNADYLSRAFRKSTGSTIGAYISDVRISYIRKIMRENEVSLDELYQKVGFSSRAYFNRFVKRATGMSPRALRLAVLAESEEKKE